VPKKENLYYVLKTVEEAKTTIIVNRRA